MIHTLRLLLETELPEPFKTYWLSPDHLDRDWRFYLVDESDLYILQHGDGFLLWWPELSCCGVALLAIETKMEGKHKPLICTCGNDSFTLKYGDYEITATCTNCGSNAVVYDG
jgi:hypothetical protein